MKAFDAIARKKGKYIQVIIPKEIADAENIKDGKKTTLMVIPDNRKETRKVYGTLQRKQPIERIMDEIDGK